MGKSTPDKENKANAKPNREKNAYLRLCVCVRERERENMVDTKTINKPNGFLTIRFKKKRFFNMMTSAGTALMFPCEHVGIFKYPILSVVIVKILNQVADLELFVASSN